MLGFVRCGVIQCERRRKALLSLLNDLLDGASRFCQARLKAGR
jgi:hypothetical protein